MPRDVDELLTLLDIETIDDNLFRGSQQASVLPRVFGGQVAAQALVAAARTTDPAYVVHSLHSYFLQPGDTGAPIVYDVEALRDGRSFATRRVLARQHGRPIFAMTTDFQKPEEGLDHQDVFPDDVPSPEDSLDPMARRSDGEFTEWDAIAMRYVAPRPTCCRRTRSGPAGSASGSRSTASCPTTRWCTQRPSPTPPT